MEVSIMRSKLSDKSTFQTPDDWLDTLSFRSAAPTPAGEGPTTAPLVEVAIRETPEEVVVRVKGEATVVAASTLDRSLLPLTARRPRLVTLDLSELRCLSTLAMGVLLRYRRAVVRAGGRVRLTVTLQPQVQEALGRAELLELFETN
jgi:anti-anti-sigma factor